MKLLVGCEKADIKVGSQLGDEDAVKVGWTYLLLVPDLENLRVCTCHQSVLDDPVSTLEPLHTLDRQSVTLVLECERLRTSQVVQQRVTRRRSDRQRESVHL